MFSLTIANFIFKQRLHIERKITQNMFLGI